GRRAEVLARSSRLGCGHPGCQPTRANRGRPRCTCRRHPGRLLARTARQKARRRQRAAAHRPVTHRSFPGANRVAFTRMAFACLYLIPGLGLGGYVTNKTGGVMSKGKVLVIGSNATRIEVR